MQTLAPLLKALGPALTPLPSVAIRFRQRRARAARRITTVAALDGFGSFRPRRIVGGRRAGRLSGTDAEGQAARAAAPCARGAGAFHGDRCGDPAQSRTDRNACPAQRGGSLLSAIDRTVTAAGARELARAAGGAADRCRRRSTARHDAVAFFVERRRAARDAAREAARRARYRARAGAAFGGARRAARSRRHRATAYPARAPLRDWLAKIDDRCRRSGGRACAICCQAHRGGVALCRPARTLLVAEPPYLARDGGFIRAGVHAPLDEVRALRDESPPRHRRLWKPAIASESGVAALKIKHNGVLGYFIEVAAQHADKLTGDRARSIPPSPDHGRRGAFFDRRTCRPWRTASRRPPIRRWRSRRELFDEMAGEALAAAHALARIADALAVLDVASALAELAAAQALCRAPRSTTAAPSRFRAAAIRWSKRRWRRTHAGFVPNDCDLSPDEGRLWLVTGPNMAGKSTFLRQNALIAILAQMGAFVPAESAHIGIVDRLFSRVGAGDDLAARALHLHGRDGGDRRDPQSGDGQKPGDPGRDRPRHRDLRRSGDRLGGGRASQSSRTSRARCSPRIITR